jgi:hypothetical protein
VAYERTGESEVVLLDVSNGARDIAFGVTFGDGLASIL